MKRTLAALLAVLSMTAVLAAPAHAGSDDRWIVEAAMNMTYSDSDWEMREFLCDEWLYNRRGFLRTVYREIYAPEGVSYYDMRVGIYRALKPLC